MCRFLHIVGPKKTLCPSLRAFAARARIASHRPDHYIQFLAYHTTVARICQARDRRVSNTDLVAQRRPPGPDHRLCGLCLDKRCGALCPARSLAARTGAVRETRWAICGSQHFCEQPLDLRARQPVVDVQPIPVVRHDPRLAQHTKLLGNVGLGTVQDGLQVAHTSLCSSQFVHDLQSGWMAERAKELRSTFVLARSHVSISLDIFKLLHIVHPETQLVKAGCETCGSPRLVGSSA
jgi:hypothetical protein